MPKLEEEWMAAVCMMDDWREENVLLVLGPGCGLAGLGCSP